uniref:Uncharacterized protein n=1 Tax=Siphoviridae sp. ctI8Q15 TaxID=2827832 RepID=A0A8S5SFT1_9CAUD|nr:MAG TPA: hypothetical protein [Siphoviridae sp. ctI8Q15]
MFSKISGSTSLANFRYSSGDRFIYYPFLKFAKHQKRINLS